MSEVITKDRDTAKHHFPQPLTKQPSLRRSSGFMGLKPCFSKTSNGWESLAAADPAFHHLKAFELAPHQEKLVLNSEGIVKLGELLACGWDQSN